MSLCGAVCVCVVWCAACVCGWVRISSEQSSEQLHGGGKVPVSYQQRTHKALICKIRYNSYIKIRYNSYIKIRYVPSVHENHRCMRVCDYKLASVQAP